MKKELQIIILGLFFISYILFLPVSANLTEFYSPNEKYLCEVGNSFKWLGESKWGLALKKNNKIVNKFPINYNPQEVHINNTGDTLILVGMVPETKDFTLDTFPALSIINSEGKFLGKVCLRDLIDTTRIKKYKNNIYWHDHEKTGFLKASNHFLLTVRSGKKHFINLENMKFVDYNGDETLFDMGWDH